MIILQLFVNKITDKNNNIQNILTSDYNFNRKVGDQNSKSVKILYAKSCFLQINYIKRYIYFIFPAKCILYITSNNDKITIEITSLLRINFYAN